MSIVSCQYRIGQLDGWSYGPWGDMPWDSSRDDAGGGTRVTITAPTVLLAAPYLPVGYVCQPETEGYTASEHLCTWSWDDGAAMASGQAASHSWTTLGVHAATVVARCPATGGAGVDRLEVNVRLPGAVIVEEGHIWLYTLRISGGSGKILRRDLLDRDAHVLAPYARLDQISAAGDLTTDAWVYVEGGRVCVSLVTAWTASPRVVPRRVVLYRLDSVDAGGVGVFTMLDSRETPGAGGGLYFYTGFDYSPGQVSNTSWPARYSTGLIDGVYAASAGTFTDYYGSHQYPSTQTITAVFGLVAAGPGRPCDTIQITEVFRVRALGLEHWYSDRPWTYKLVAPLTGDFGLSGIANARASYSDPSTTTSGWDPSWYGAAQPVGGGSVPSLTAATFAHPAGFTDLNEHAIFWGTAEIYNNYNFNAGTGTHSTAPYYVGAAGRSLQVMPALPSVGGDAIVGLWGDAEALVVRRAGAGLDYSQFYVRPVAGVAGGAAAYSLFSWLAPDGSIVHMEDVEAPTPTLWRDARKIADLN